MKHLITILRAAHCRSTHQFFVLDALPLVESEQAKRLASQLLRHYKQYLKGAKDPTRNFATSAITSCTFMTIIGAAPRKRRRNGTSNSSARCVKVAGPMPPTVPEC